MIPTRPYNLSVSGMDELSTAIKIRANLGQDGGRDGILDFNGRRYLVKVTTQTVERQFHGPFSRIASAIWDFFARGGSMTTRAQIIENIIFGRQRPVLPVSTKTGSIRSLAAFAARLQESGVDMRHVQYRTDVGSTDVPVIQTAEGAAKNFNRSVIVRSWLDKVDEDPVSPVLSDAFSDRGHAAFEVWEKNGAQKKSAYISVYPAETDDFMRFESFYYKDRGNLLSNWADRRLREGWMEPRPFQFRLAETERTGNQAFGVSASSEIYLPCYGLNWREGGRKPVKVLFGLSQQHAADAVCAMKDDNVEYSAASLHRNCSGVVFDMLRAGGAGRFVRFPSAHLYRTPRELDRYASEVRAYLGGLNQYTGKLIALISPVEITDWDQISSSGKEAVDAWSGAPRSVRRCVAELERDFDSMSNEDRIDRAKILVELLADELGERPKAVMSGLDPAGPAKAKKNALLWMINMVHAIREKVCEVSSAEGASSSSAPDREARELPVAPDAEQIRHLPWREGLPPAPFRQQGDDLPRLISPVPETRPVPIKIPVINEQNAGAYLKHFQAMEPEKRGDFIRMLPFEVPVSEDDVIAFLKSKIPETDSSE